ncbi:glutaredoxin 3 [uncultured Abyssibacter sp.]|uniref:glutaredoxin 3 n=1 Tax=uncultured Abyssibacter sp. TaxID=2320202 RepID=UPI0032B2E0B0
MPRIEIYTTRYCPYCLMAKRLLQARGLAFDEIAVDEDPDTRRAMTRRAGRHTVPQIFIGETHVGGCDDLHAMDASGELTRVLQQQG